MDPTTLAAISIVVACISEVLSLYPKIKANGIIQLILMVLNAAFKKK